MQEGKGTITGLALGILLAAGPASGNYLQGLDNIPGAPVIFTEANAASANGSVVVGKTVYDDGVSEFGSETAFWWKDGTGMHSLGEIPTGGQTFSATVVSGDGRTVAGITHAGIVFVTVVDDNGTVTGNASITGMGHVGAISRTGKFIAGSTGPLPTSANIRVVRNFDPTSLTVGETLTAETFLEGKEIKGVPSWISDDGSIIAGYVDNKAFILESDVPTIIEFDATDQGVKLAGMSADGTILAGTRTTSSFLGVPFYWKAGQTELLSTGAFNQVSVVGISPDGKTIIGVGSDNFARKRILLWIDEGSGTYTGPGEVLLSNSNLPGTFQIQTVTGTSSDGGTVVGWGSNSGARTGFRVLLGAQTWGPYLVFSDGMNVDTEGLMGWVNISSAPWVYVYNLNNYVYLPEAFINQSGTWIWIGL